MALLFHDTTDTSTDCPRPLSRKKLRQLMPQNRNLTSGALMDKKNPFHIAGRTVGLKLFAGWRRKHMERAKLRKQFSKHTLPDGTTLQLVPKPHEVEARKPSLFERASGLFAKLRKQFEREKAKGK